MQPSSVKLRCEIVTVGLPLGRPPDKLLILYEHPLPMKTPKQIHIRGEGEREGIPDHKHSGPEAFLPSWADSTTLKAGNLQA